MTLAPTQEQQLGPHHPWCPWQDAAISSLRNQETTSSFPSPLLIWELFCPYFSSVSFFFFFFLGFTCTSLFTHTCPHRASGINLAELKIINPVVEEGVPLTCAEAHLLTPFFRCILQVRGLPRRFIFITTAPRFFFTRVCQGASGKSPAKFHI